MARLGWKAALAGVVTAGAAAGAYAAIVRPRMLRWGATRDDVYREWPGDSLAPGAPELVIARPAPAETPEPAVTT